MIIGETVERVLRTSGPLQLLAIMDRTEEVRGGYLVLTEKVNYYKVESQGILQEHRAPFLLAPHMSVDELNDVWEEMCTNLGDGYEPLFMVPPMTVEKTRMDAMDQLPF